MRKVVVAVLLTALLGGCAVHPVRGCVNRPGVCAAIAGGAVAGATYLATSGVLSPTP